MRTVFLALALLAAGTTTALAYDAPYATDDRNVATDAPLVQALIKLKVAPTIEDLLGDLLDNDGRERAHHTPDTTVNPEEPVAPIVLVGYRYGG